jgi:hypothetical protein
MSNTTPGARLDIARALFHTGQLGDRLFSFPRKKDEPLIPDLRAGWEAYLPTSEAFLDLGLVNAAQHYACESLEIGGPGLWTLRQLSKVCLLKGQPAASRIFLKRLSSVPGHADWAAERLEAIESDPGNARCAELAALRPMCLTVDYPYQGLPIEDLLQKLLEANATNRMAFEFMMAHCLLSFQLDRFIRELPRFETLGYVRLPRHYEEALLLHQRNNPAAAQPLKRHTIARETQERFARFQKVISDSGRPAHELESALAGEFGDTLWFYYAFGRTASASRSVPAS